MTYSTNDAHGGHEKRDVTFRPIVIGGVATFVVLALIFALVRLTLSGMGAHEARISPRVNPLSRTFGRQAPPEPRLQIHPVQDLAAMRAAEEEKLNNYDWIDKPHGVVRLPITRAMELLVQRGLPARAREEQVP